MHGVVNIIIIRHMMRSLKKIFKGNYLKINMGLLYVPCFNRCRSTGRANYFFCK